MNTRLFSVKVSVLGGAGGIGQSLCLLLKQSSAISSLAIYDKVGADGVATDLSHINTRCTVVGYGPEDNGLTKALLDANIVVITAGRAGYPGRDLKTLFIENAPIIFELVTAIAETCPNAIICIASNPINSLVPLATQIMLMHNVLDTRRIFGILSLDVMRASLIAGKYKRTELSSTFVPIIGGHSESTTVPVFSQIRPAVSINEEEQKYLSKRIRAAIFEVTVAKAGGYPTLSMAHAAYHFLICLLEAMHGVPGIVECTYVRSDVSEVKYLCNPILLGPNGVEVNLGIGPLSSVEKDSLTNALHELKMDIIKGEKWILSNIALSK